MRLLPGLLCVSALTLTASYGLAQELPLGSVAVAGGLTLPIGEARQAMGNGWNVSVAGNVRVAAGLGLRADYLYSRFASETATWDVTLGPMLPAFMEVGVRAKSQMHTGSVDVTWTRQLSNEARAYLMAGPSVFHRRVQLTGTGPQGQTTACEPLWLQCSSQPVGFDRALGIKSSNDLGFNVGAGVAFRAGLTALLTIEARYFYVRGPAFQAPDGRSLRGSARFVPVSVGLTF